MKNRLYKKRLKQLREKPFLVEVFDLPKGEYQFPFKQGDVLVCIGEIEQMPGHVVLANKEGKILWGWDQFYFRKLTKEES
jgi:hypothetical protein